MEQYDVDSVMTRIDLIAQVCFAGDTEAMVKYNLVVRGKVLKELQPGLPKPMKQAFEVPEQVIKSKGLKLLVPQKGFGGSGEILVPLT